MAGAMKPYQYQTLARGEIRTLVLEPGQPGDDTRVSIQLVCLLQLQLERDDKSSTPAKYEAVSYAWGSSDLPHSIPVDDQYQLAVTRSVFEVLQHFRFSSSWRTLWIDATCIDQHNLAEKSIQVGMMGQIYAGAENVLIWLGSCGGHMYLAFAMLKAVTYSRDGRLSTEQDTGEVLLNQAQDCENWDKLHAYEDFTNPKSDFYCACCDQKRRLTTSKEALSIAAAYIQQLADRDWFRRLWVAQEIALAKTGRLWICSGYHMGSFDIIQGLISWVNYGESHGCPRPGFRAYCRGSVLIDLISIVSIRMMVKGKDTDFMEIFLYSWHMLCKEPLDRIYAIRSITDVARWNDITVDYSIEPAVLFAQIVARYFKHVESLEEISWCSSAALLSIAPLTMTTSRPWPSWVADLNRPSQRCEDRIEKYRTTGQGCFQVAPLRMWHTKSPSQLRLAGLEFGTIKSVAKDSDLNGCLHSAVAFDAELSSNMGIDVDQSKVGSRVTRCSSFLHLHGQSNGLSAQIDATKERSTCYDAQNVVCALDHFRFGTRTGTEICVNHEHQCLAILSALVTDSDWSAVHLLRWFQSAKVPFLDIEPDRVIAAIDVEDTTWFGWVPQAAKSVDQLCFVFGAPFPFVVRQAHGDKTYTLVGDALVPGIRQADTGWDDDSGWHDDLQHFITLH